MRVPRTNSRPGSWVLPGILCLVSPLAVEAIGPRLGPCELPPRCAAMVDRLGAAFGMPEFNTRTPPEKIQADSRCEGGLAPCDRQVQYYGMSARRRIGDGVSLDESLWVNHASCGYVWGFSFISNRREESGGFLGLFGGGKTSLDESVEIHFNDEGCQRPQLSCEGRNGVETSGCPTFPTEESCRPSGEPDTRPERFARICHVLFGTPLPPPPPKPVAAPPTPAPAPDECPEPRYLLVGQSAELEELITALGSEDFEVRRNAFGRLNRTTGDLDLLVRIVQQDPNENTRREALGQLKSVETFSMSATLRRAAEERILALDPAAMSPNLLADWISVLEGMAGRERSNPRRQALRARIRALSGSREPVVRLAVLRFESRLFAERPSADARARIEALVFGLEDGRYLSDSAFALLPLAERRLASAERQWLRGVYLRLRENPEVQSTLWIDRGLRALEGAH